MWAGIVLGCALLVSLGDLFSAINADAMIPALMSVQKWTPFFWGNAGRVGSLVPAIAIPIAGPVANWTFQCFLTTIAGLACFVLVPWYVIEGPAWRTLGPLAALVWLASQSTHILAGWFAPGQPYAVALALGLLALGFPRMGGWQPGRFGPVGPLAAGVLMLAYWVDSGLGLLLVPLWAARRALRTDPIEWPALGLILGIQTAWVGWYTLTDIEPRYLGHLPILRVPGAIADALRNSVSESGTTWVVALSVVLLVAFGLPRLAGEQSRRAGALGCAALLSMIPVACNAWVDANQHSARYYLAPMVLATCAVCSLVPFGPGRMAIPTLVLPLALLRFGLPSLQGVRAQLAAMAPLAERVDQGGCTAVAGPYWATWPTVMEVLELRYERGDPRPVYGLTARGEETLDLATSLPEARGCTIRQDPAP